MTLVKWAPKPMNIYDDFDKSWPNEEEAFFYESEE